MTGYSGKKTNSFDDIVGEYTLSERNTTWGPIPGEIVSYDHISGSATVQPLFRPNFNGETVAMPVLYEVPVDMPRTGSSGLTFPVPAGTKVTLTPQMRALDDYDNEGEGGAYDARSFHISNMRASISGGNSFTDYIQNPDPDNVHLRFSNDGQFGIKGSSDGKMQLTGAQGDILVIIAEALELLASETTTVSSGSSSGAWPLTHQSQFSSLAAKLRASIIE